MDTPTPTPTPTDTTLQSRIDDLERTLTEARASLDAVERRHAIDLALLEADAADLESARLLTEVAVTAMPTRDIKAAVADLRARKPFLFRARANSNPPAAAMSSAPSARSALRSDADSAADEAARTGDRRALLRYLRARRGK
jgi:hypothetical protein